MWSAHKYPKISDGSRKISNFSILGDWILLTSDMVLIHNTVKVQYNLCHGKLLNQGRGNKAERGSSNIHYTRNHIVAIDFVWMFDCIVMRRE